MEDYEHIKMKPLSKLESAKASECHSIAVLLQLDLLVLGRREGGMHVFYISSAMRKQLP